MDIHGLDELSKTLNNASNNFNKEAEKAINEVANYILKNVKLKTPVAKENGGTLRRSWQVKKTDTLTRVIYNNLHYAPHVEFGHRTRLGTGKSKPKGKIKFVKGRYMLRKSLELAENKMETEFSSIIENLWKE